MQDFSVNKENKTINVKREFAAELPLVWNAYTQSDILDQWWAPEPWKARTKSMDFRDGGQWVYAMVGPNGEEHFALANYSNIQPQKKFTVKDAFSDAAGNINKELPQSQWDVTFTDKGPKTLVEIFISFEHLADLEKIVAMGFREGLLMAMENLDEMLAVKA